MQSFHSTGPILSGSDKQSSIFRPTFLRTAGSGSESATQIINEINSLMKKQATEKMVDKRDRTATVLETEEAGFSAIEEDVNSPKVNTRPTVYAGMSKYERYPFSQGVVTNANEEYFDSKAIRDQYGIDGDILDQDLVRKSNTTMINKFYHSSNN